MATATVAQERDQAVKPAYTLEALEGTVEREVRFFNNDTRKITTKVVEEPAGFMVKTMRGDKVRIKSLEELASYGLADDIPLIAEQIGQQVGKMPNVVAKGAK